MAKNGYLERQKQLVNANRQAEKETMTQFLVDTLCITLNDPEVMGRNAFGRKRLTRVVNAWMATYDLYYGALLDKDSKELREKMDQKLSRILRSECEPFQKRYEWLKEPKENRKR